MVRQLYGIARSLKDKGRKGWSFVYKVNKLLANIGVPLTQRFNHKSGVDTGHEIIVSLTTFPDRISTVWITIATIMNQTYKPKRIILWLAKDQFPDEADIPESLHRLVRRGLEIRFCEDLKPHKKYYFTMQENPEDYVVTIDDDVLYPENHLEQLWQTHLKNPGVICCQYAHRITYDNQGNIAVYSWWQGGCTRGTTPSMQYMPVGCGGVLYPPHVLDDRIFDKQAIVSLCPRMDDLWLKSMGVLKGTKAVTCSMGSMIYFDVLGTRKSGLQHSNAGEHQNDVAIKAIVAAYPEVQSKLYEDYVKGEK